MSVYLLCSASSASRHIPLFDVSDDLHQEEGSHVKLCWETFKSSAKAIQAVLADPEVKQYSSMVGLQWHFNLEKAPWWGGMFKRMVKSTKRCLRKAIGRAN